MQNWMKNLAPPALCMVLLAALALDKQLLQQPSADTELYHQHVRLAAEKLPYQVGDWVGEDVEVPVAAVTMLKPNVILSRRFQNLRTGREAVLLLVQCSDARDLLGHYPPICYVTHGWRQLEARPRSWEIAGMAIKGTEYQFVRETLDGSTPLAIANFMVLPRGGTAPDMAAVNDVAQDFDRKFYGAAQVQLVMSANVPSPERDDAFETIVGSTVELLEAIDAAEKAAPSSPGAQAMVTDGPGARVPLRVTAASAADVTRRASLTSQTTTDP